MLVFCLGHEKIILSYNAAQSEGQYGNYRGRGERRKVANLMNVHEILILTLYITPKRVIGLLMTVTMIFARIITAQVGGGGLVVQGSAHLSAPAGQFVSPFSLLWMGLKSKSFDC